MTCYKIFFGTFFLAFFSLVGFSSSVFAVDDITVSYSANSVINGNSPLFSSCDDSNCLSQYSYLIITADNIDFNNSYGDFCFVFRPNSWTSRNVCFYPYSTTSIFTLPASSYNLHFVSYNQNLSYDFSVTLTDSLGEPCPEPDPCPEPEQCPEASDTPYADKFDNIEKAIYTCGAILIMLYFFYCIYRMIIKGSGVN